MKKKRFDRPSRLLTGSRLVLFNVHMYDEFHVPDVLIVLFYLHVKTVETKLSGVLTPRAGTLTHYLYGSMHLQANCCTLVAPCVLVCWAGVFWREPRALTTPSWKNRRAEVLNESIMYPREMERGSKERDGGGGGKENR